MLIKLHGIFAERYGKEHRIEADSAADAIAGFTRQVSFFEDLPLEERPIVKVAGFNTPQALYEKTEQNEIHLVPAMIGGGAFGKIVVGAALIAFALTNPLGWSTLAITAVMSVGVSVTMMGVMQLFTKAPTISKSNDPEASQYLGLSDNSVAIGTPIPIQYGRGPATGHLLAVNVDSNEIVQGQFPA